MASIFPFLLFNLAFLGFYIYLIKYYNQSKYPIIILVKFFWIGAFGWIIALLRTVILQIIQVSIYISSGVDFNVITETELANLPINFTYKMLIWGPILSAIFMESIRFLFILKSAIKRDRKFLPLVFGLGWSFGETFVLSLPNIQSEFHIVIIISVYERLIYTVFHVAMSYLVYYAIYENKLSNKLSLWLAMLANFTVNFFIVLTIIELRDTDLWNSDNYLLVLVGGLTVVISVFVLFVKYVWIPKKEIEYQKLIKKVEGEITTS